MYNGRRQQDVIEGKNIYITIIVTSSSMVNVKKPNNGQEASDLRFWQAGLGLNMNECTRARANGDAVVCTR
jgi:hypothetical protein